MFIPSFRSSASNYFIPPLLPLVFLSISESPQLPVL